ncbi:MAG: hypothetical protein QOJ96_2186 [Alphaproteobacteria bacterium]|jgi:hypothetical protein|nr:hypothetical protein [Alphaproteobacteria bacterium]
MYVSLLVLGVIATAAGVAMIGFGIPIHEFSLGNTLLITGTTAIVGGLILIGLAGAVKQLRRIAEALMARPVPWAPRPDLVAPEPSRPAAGPGRVPFPPKPVPEDRANETAVEPRLDSAPSADASKSGMFDPPSLPFPETASAPEVVISERHEAFVFPPPSRSSAPDLRADRMEDATETGSAGSADSTETELMPISRLDAILRSPPPEMPGPVAEEQERAEAHEPDEATAEPQAVSILKSGVIDGMAYTLYSDGSIEAELPQGTIRFASITELRAYLEKSS